MSNRWTRYLYHLSRKQLPKSKAEKHHSKNIHYVCSFNVIQVITALPFFQGLSGTFTSKNIYFSRTHSFLNLTCFQGPWQTLPWWINGKFQPSGNLKWQPTVTDFVRLDLSDLSLFPTEYFVKLVSMGTVSID